MSADPLTRDLVESDKLERHQELMAQWNAGLIDSCIAFARMRRWKTYEALNHKKFSDFVKSMRMAAATAKRTANAGDILEFIPASLRAQIGHIDALRPILDLANEEQSREMHEQVLRKQVKIVHAAIAEAGRSLVPVTADLVQTVARRFNVLPRAEYQALKRQKEQKSWLQSPEKRRRNVVDAISQAISTLAFYESDVRGTKLDRADIHIEELRAMPGFEVALMLLIDARDA